MNNQSPIKVKSKRSKAKSGRWLRRIIFAVMMPIALLLLSLFLLTAMDNGATNELSDFLDGIWWQATALRLVLYLLLAFLILPSMIKRAADKNEQAIALLSIKAKQAEEADEQLYYESLIDRKKAQATAFAGYLNHRLWIFMGFVVFDLAVVQLPYFLRG